MFQAAVNGEVSETVKQQLPGELHASLAAAFEKSHPGDHMTGPGVIRVRAAITAVGKPNKGVNAAIQAAAFFVPAPIRTVGGAAIEAEAVDAVTGVRLIAILAGVQGGKGPLGGFTSYAHAKNALAGLAKASHKLAVDTDATSWAKSQ